MATLAWIDGDLYLACVGQGLFRWRAAEPWSRSEPVNLGSALEIQALTPLAHRLLIADRRGILWSYAAGRGLEQIARTPEPVVAVLASSTDIVVAGRTALWRRPMHKGDHVWSLVAVARACALAWPENAHRQDDRALWSAGPDGLFYIALKGGTLSVHWLVPTTGVATMPPDSVLLADGARITRVPVVFEGSSPQRGTQDDTRPPRQTPTPEPKAAFIATPGPGYLMPIFQPNWSRVRARARWTWLLPQLSISASLARTEQEPNSFDSSMWLRLTWTPNLLEVTP